MKTQGKVPVIKNDFLIVNEKLAHGIDRLRALPSEQLSEDQHTAITAMVDKMDHLQQAATACYKADSLTLSGARHKAIDETIIYFDLDKLNFDQERQAFGLFERFEESRISTIDRDSEVENLVSDICGFDAEAEYQGTLSE